MTEYMILEPNRKVPQAWDAAAKNEDGKFRIYPLVTPPTLARLARLSHREFVISMNSWGTGVMAIHIRRPYNNE